MILRIILFVYERLAERYRWVRKGDDSSSFFRLFLLYIIAITFLVIFFSQYGITDIRFLVCSWAAFLIFSIAILGLEKFVKYQKDKSRKE